MVKILHSRSLIALSTTALALPGIATADAPPTQSTLSYKISNYKEDKLSRSEVPFGDLDRYDIDVHQFQLVSPISRNMSVEINANYESLSGASPWFTSTGLNGEPIVNLSGASGIRDRRSEINIGSTYYLENGSFSANLGYSEEDDYRATYFGVNGEQHFNNDLTSVSLGFSYSADDIFPTDAKIFNRVNKEDKRSTSAFMSISQVINQFSSFQSAISLTRQSGFLSDPYKLIDVRPESKRQISWSNSYRRFFKNANAAWHINYRYYHDDFGISSHTVDMSWHQNIGRSIKVIPIVRYYSQSAANFFTNVDDFLKPVTQYQSSDYRLSAFGAISGGLNFVADLGQWTATLSTERYIANEKYSAYNVSKVSTALVSYNRISLGIEYSF
ncbi:MAG: hypothetical protein COA96_17580 [SAR86 cluster bacterium]|uniref:DUF3570 domain-containing protein n=1 Tax=SAR86 cluster bacterium TaxID=2030880 RepID=A0A2A5AEJ2_9GAMM|nr:MAG: hypothetical protein COA96_17580 [SAR86 cluster bacterium]